ncbi:MAG: RluA family pseudouridine synthase [Elusimicrobia bacterium]|nr:RluA family pseudouridine synthase [Candidatus Obscuribacterium magneticum]
MHVDRGGDRLDRFLAVKFPAWSRTRLQGLIKKGHVLVDGVSLKSNARLRKGQVVTVKWEIRRRGPVSGERGQGLSRQDLTPFSDIFKKCRMSSPDPVPIVYEDGALLVVDKPAGLVVHPSAGHFDGDTLVELLRFKLEEGFWPDDLRPGLVHRLDRDTSGVIVLAKTPQAQTQLSRQFAHREVKKVYLALVQGAVQPSTGTLESYLSRDPRLRQRFAVSGSGRFASTKFKVVERFGDVATLLDVYPLTGRTHQIRIQLAAYGHPILGDRIYHGRGPVSPSPVVFRPLKAKPDHGHSSPVVIGKGVHEWTPFPYIARQMLHAAAIELTHPLTGRRVKFSAPPPDDFQAAIKLIRLNS